MKITIRGMVAATLVLQVITVVCVVAMREKPEGVESPQYEETTVVATESLSVALEEGEVQEDPLPLYSQEEVARVAKTIYGEARGCSEAEKRLVAWCILNRVDDGTWGDTIEDVVTYPNAFHGYDESWPEDGECIEVAQDVLAEWKTGGEADVLEPYATTSEYLYFGGDGEHNWFREEY